MNAMALNTDFSNCSHREVSVLKVETYWGYIIRNQARDRTGAMLKQWSSAFFGVSLLIAVAGLWVLPGALVSQDVFGFKLGLSAVMGAIAVMLFWFASYGTHHEVQIHLARKELHEVLRSNKGSARVLNRIKFEDIDAVQIDRSAGSNEKCDLMVRGASSSGWIVLASDYVEHLTSLETRVAHDILGVAADKPARGFLNKGARGVVPPLAA